MEWLIDIHFLFRAHAAKRYTPGKTVHAHHYTMVRLHDKRLLWWNISVENSNVTFIETMLLDVSKGIMHVDSDRVVEEAGRWAPRYTP